MGLDHRSWWWLPLLVKGTGRDAIGAIGTALVIFFFSISVAGVFLYCCWYRLLDMLLLLLVGAYESLAGSNPRIGLIGLASGGGSNKHSTASSRHLSLPCLYISSFLILIIIKARRGWTQKYSSDRFRQSFLHLLGMIQAFKLADQIMGSHPGEATLLVGWNAAMPGGLKSSGRWHRLTYNKSTLAFIVLFHSAYYY